MRLVGAVLALWFSPFPALAQSVDDWFYPTTSLQALSLKEGEVITISAGDPIVGEITQNHTGGAILMANVDLPKETKSNVRLAKGESLIRFKSKTAYKACTVIAHKPSGPECLIDDDGDGLFDRGAKNYVTNGQPLSHQVPYNIVDQVALPSSNSNFQRALFYQGATSASLKISYREFADGLARPAFTQDLEIPLSSTFPQKVSAKGVVITIFGIDGLGLKYEIAEGSQFR